MDPKKLTRLVSGLCVSRLATTEEGAVAIYFTNGSSLIVEPNAGRVVATFQAFEVHAMEPDSGYRPTPGQRAYLEFIQKYMARFVVAPAEADIQRHFLVSAPSVNQMVRTLERRGFITRQRDFLGQVMPRSIRIVDPY